jgi:prepilin-type N-terminal cleavage/methylation domain-containing protein
MNSTATNHFRPRRLPVQWLEAPGDGSLLIGGAHAPSRVVFGAPPNISMAAPLFLPARRRPMHARARALPESIKIHRSLRAFTLLELMMVIAIIGFIAAVTLPHVHGFGQANSMSAATRQLLDDVALARQRAMVNRSTVYMVFVPPEFWKVPQYTGVFPNRQETNLLTHQYAAYALISLGSVGDQPGQHYPRYLTDWRFLPAGVFLAPFQFTLTNNPPTYTNITTTNTLSDTVINSQIYAWNTAYVPFPSIYPGNNPLNPQSTNFFPLPCIAFSPQGGLATQSTNQYNQYIVLARGSIFYPTDTNGAPLFAAPNMVETPPGNDVNNPNLIQIDWVTARPTLLQNQLQ